MNVLFYVEPLIEMEKPYWKDCWATDFCRFMIDALSQSKELKSSYCIAVNEPINELLPFSNEVMRVVFAQDELLPPFEWSALAASLAWYKEDASKGQMDYYVKLMRTKFVDFPPDIIISFSPAPFFRHAFPSSLLLHMEYSIFSRAPYPQTWFLDPIGILGNSFLKTFSDQIKHSNIPSEDKEWLSSLKNSCRELISAKSPFKDLVEKEKNKFTYLVLLPLQFSGFYGFDGNTFLRTQYEYLVYVLEMVPESVGVVVTTHPEYPILTEDTLRFLRGKYPHLIHHSEFEEYNASSQFLIADVDGVITISSSVGFQTLIWDKKLITIGDCFGELLSDSVNISDIEEVLSKPTVDKDQILYWIITNYAIPKSYLEEPRWLAEFLSKSLARFRNEGVTHSFFDPIDDPRRLLQKITGSLDRNIPRAATVKSTYLRIREKEHQLKELAGKLEQAESNIRELKTQNAAMKTTLEISKNDLSNCDSKISKLNKHLQHVEEECHTLRNINEHFQHVEVECHFMRNKIENLENNVYFFEKQLHEKNVELSISAKYIADLTQSLSWKLTAPFRAINLYLRLLVHSKDMK